MSLPIVAERFELSTLAGKIATDENLHVRADIAPTQEGIIDIVSIFLFDDWAVADVVLNQLSANAELTIQGKTKEIHLQLHTD